MFNAKQLKKDLQKVAKDIRAAGGYYETPKAMMTERQIKNNTATLNCDHWKVEEIKARVIDTPAFSSLVQKYNLTFFMFTDNYGHNHIRLNYSLEA